MENYPSRPLEYNATSTTFSKDEGEDVAWKILGIAIVTLWVFSIFTCICNFKPSQDRQRNRSEILENQRREREAKILHPEPEKRENVIASVIITKRVTKKSDDGGIEFSEQNNTALVSQNAEDKSTSTLACKGDHENCTAAENTSSMQEDYNGDGGKLELTCSVCLDDFEVGDELSWSRQLKCQHVFHSECLTSWLMKNVDCPVCRTVLIEEEDFYKCQEESVSASESENSTSTESESLDPSSGMFLVLNGMVSLVRNTRYNILSSQENIHENIDNSVFDESISTPERQTAEESLEGCVDIDTGCDSKERNWRKGSEKTRRGNYNIISSVGSDEEEGLSIS